MNSVTPKIRVLVVDDSVVMRRLISEVVGEDPDLEVVGVAANGRIALQKIPQVNPDAITMDVEMPDMDGLATLKELRKTYPKLPVIMFSTLTKRGAISTLDALAAGATDYVTKPANVGSVTESLAGLRTQLVPRIKLHCRSRRLPLTPPPPVPAPRTQFSSPGLPCSPRSTDAEIVCVGVSTGGPNALAEVFAKVPAGLAVPVVIVQHMPPLFTGLLAERLGQLGKLQFHEGQQGMPLQAGHAYVAPGGRHMEVRLLEGRMALQIHDGPPENSCRPAVDVLFRSVAAAFGSKALGVILTGMGHDGLRGCEELHARHASVIVQDEATSVIWGMPGAVAHAHLADKILPLHDIAREIASRVRSSATPIRH